MSFNLEMAARTVWMEARGEPTEAQIAVAWVIVNRLNAGKWGSTLCAVVLEPMQFSSWNTNDTNRESMAHLSELDPDVDRMAAYVQGALDGSIPDPSGGATFYFNSSICKPSWASKFINLGNVGSQTFMKEGTA